MFRRDISGARSIPGPLAHGSSARKISPYNLWLQNPAGIESMEETSGVPSSYSRGVQLIFTRGHISLMVASKGPNVELLAPS